jgi:hypothetical protein
MCVQNPWDNPSRYASNPGAGAFDNHRHLPPPSTSNTRSNMQQHWHHVNCYQEQPAHASSGHHFRTTHTPPRFSPSAYHANSSSHGPFHPQKDTLSYPSGMHSTVARPFSATWDRPTPPRQSASSPAHSPAWSSPLVPSASPSPLSGVSEYPAPTRSDSTGSPFHAYSLVTLGTATPAFPPALPARTGTQHPSFSQLTTLAESKRAPMQYIRDAFNADVNQSVFTLAISNPTRQPLRARPDEDVHWLLRLPPRFWDTMRSYLPYGVFLDLASLSRDFALVRLHTFVRWRFRYEQVVSLEHRDPNDENRNTRIRDNLRLKHSKPRMLPCYLCFSMKHEKCFQITGEMKETGRQQQTQFTHALVKERNRFTGERIFDPAQQREAVIIPRNQIQRLSTASWQPGAPGAEEGEMESLRRYCLDCAMKTGLSVPGDVIEIVDHSPSGNNVKAAEGHEATRKRWICKCPAALDEIKEECPSCGTPQNFRMQDPTPHAESRWLHIDEMAEASSRFGSVFSKPYSTD